MFYVCFIWWKILNKRYIIRQLIAKNKIREAVAKINSLNKDILKENKIIYFILQKQILINFIQENNSTEFLIIIKYYFLIIKVV